MANLIGIVTPTLNGARRDSEVALQVAFSFGAQQMLEAGGKALLVLYDLDQYLANQSTLAAGGETTEDFFRGRKRVFDFPPEHRVEPGSGVLFRATVTFKSRKVSAFTESFVSEVADVDAIAAPAFKLKFQCKNAVDQQGRPQSPEVVDLDTIVVSGPAVEDFSAFTELGNATRKLTFRLLKSDLSEVLVSQLNPTDCNQSTPIKALYEVDLAARKVGAAAKEPSDAPPPKKSRMPFDLTGEYAQLRDPDDNPNDVSDLITPAVLRIHHVGRAVCGWFSPMPASVLTARAPNTVTDKGALLFDPPFKVFSKERMIFALGKQIAADPPTFRAIAKFDSGDLDPDDLFATNDEEAFTVPDDELTQLHVRLLDPEPGADGPQFRRVQLFQAPADNVLELPIDVFGFRRISSSSRLAFRTLKQVIEDNPLTPEQQPQVRDALMRSVVERIPAGVLNRLIAMIASPEMDELVRQFFLASQGSAKIFPAEEVGRALGNLAASLRSLSGETVLSTELIVQVRNVARAHDLVIDGQTTDMLSALQIISNEIIEAELAKDPQHTRGSVPLNLEERMSGIVKTARYEGFAAFNIRPGRDILYRFEFEPLGDFGGNFIILSGSIGAFRVTVSKLDRVTGKDLDRRRFPPQQFTGVFAAGALGAGIKIESDGTDPKPKPKVTFGATIGPINAEVVSFSNIPAEDFDGADFTVFASGASAKVSLVTAVGAQAKSQAAVFSLTTNGATPVTLEAEINTRFELKEKNPQAKDLIDAARESGQAHKENRKAKVAKATVMLTLASLCKGIFVRETFNAAPRAEKQTETAQGLSARKLETNARVLATQFSRESAAIDGAGREMLELRLAVLRKLLEYPGWMDIEGTTSPEWSDSGAGRETAAAKNLKLSLRRAQATRSAIFAAAGDPGEGPIPLEKDIRVVGKGAEPFRELFGAEQGPVDPATGEPDPHLDPFSPKPPESDPEALRRHQAVLERDRAVFYPKLRRVDIVTNGVFIASIPTK